MQAPSASPVPAELSEQDPDLLRPPSGQLCYQPAAQSPALRHLRSSGKRAQAVSWPCRFLQSPLGTPPVSGSNPLKPQWKRFHPAGLPPLSPPIPSGLPAAHSGQNCRKDGSLHPEGWTTSALSQVSGAEKIAKSPATSQTRGVRGPLFPFLAAESQRLVGTKSELQKPV